MEQAYPDISPEVKQRLHSQGLKPYKLQPIPALANPYSYSYWGMNIAITGLALLGRYHAKKHGYVRYMWSYVAVIIPVFAIGAKVKLEGFQSVGGHRRTLEEKLDYSPVTRRAWAKATEENQKYQDGLKEEILQLELEVLKRNQIK